MITIRPVQPTDTPLLLPLLVAMGFVDNPNAAEARIIRSTEDKNHFLPVALFNNQIIGYAWVQDYGAHLRSGEHTARLHDLFVLPQYRKRGIARSLMEAIVDWAQNQPIKWLQWQASASAVPFYERLGYTGERCPDPEHPFFEIEFE